MSEGQGNVDRIRTASLRPLGYAAILFLGVLVSPQPSLADAGTEDHDWSKKALSFSKMDTLHQESAAKQYVNLTLSGRGVVHTVKRCARSDDSKRYGSACTKITVQGRHNHGIVLYLPPSMGTELMPLTGKVIAFHSCQGRWIQIWGLGTKQTCDLIKQNIRQQEASSTPESSIKTKPLEWSRALRRLMTTNSKKREKHLRALAKAHLKGVGKIRSVKPCSWLDTASAYAPNCQKLVVDAGKAQLNIYAPTKGPLARPSLEKGARFRFKRCTVVHRQDWVLWVAVSCDLKE